MTETAWRDFAARREFVGSGRARHTASRPWPFLRGLSRKASPGIVPRGLRWRVLGRLGRSSPAIDECTRACGARLCRAPRSDLRQPGDGRFQSLSAERRAESGIRGRGPERGIWKAAAGNRQGKRRDRFQLPLRTPGASASRSILPAGPAGLSFQGASAICRNVPG